MNWVEFEDRLHEIGRLRHLLRVMNGSRHYRACFVDTPRQDIHVDDRRMIRVLWEMEMAVKRMRELLEEGIKEDA